MSKLPDFHPKKAISSSYGSYKKSELINFEFRNQYWNSISEFRNSISELEALALSEKRDIKFAFVHNCAKADWMAAIKVRGEESNC